ncbi:hypothetical protein F7U82_01940 [Vibrio parahaemolyticus]|uniref:hypothetical protein n=1 Tax=Vibrio vulnificus TaxID=672 RepID=UPI001028C75A|nr:hypothetical protein [Vibrio vulnificus]EGQ9304260.1 hypothetical protein [Vibrio parahaemolyticus]EJG0039881.1 hypothetical protein [Vibrio parahaemolyticus]EJX1339438.1 hypothetical protein [Vibrio parahaemolyticus]EKA4511957.1 hypothetical protein [Vibrio parahaemolyticus]RZP95092.1 hypothetical protein D8T54_14550 [Vibrio vulnificus]
MELNEKAKVTAIYQELNKVDASEPNKLVSTLENSAKLAVKNINHRISSDEDIKTSVFNFSHMNEQYRRLSQQQMKIVDSVQMLAKKVESLGYEKPSQDNWLSKTLSNYQRGYLENDIFTEAAGALVWMAAKAVQKIFFESDKGKQQQEAHQLKKDIGKMTKVLGVELSRLHQDTKLEQRHEQMSQAIGNAQQLEQRGQQKEADKLIVNAYNNLSSTAKKEYGLYEPRPEHQKIIFQAQSREKLRHEARTQNQLSSEQVKERDKSKSIER